MHQTSKHSSDLNSQEEDYFGYYYHTPGVLPGTLEIASDAKPS